jgi:hypothetical protein
MIDQFRDEDQRRAALTVSEREKILEIDPSFQAITNATYFDNYDLPCPIKVEVDTRGNKSTTVVLRKARHGNVEVEVEIFRALKEFGLPVPEILSAPFRNENDERVTIYSLLEGESLQHLSMRSEDGLQEAKGLVIQAVRKLLSASSFMAHHEVSKLLPRRTLLSELETVKRTNSAWSRTAIFQSGVKHLQGVLPEIDTPLVFSNGDYQPGNFLACNGKVTGFVDFESPSFEDPLMGFVKYPVYDLHPLSKTNVVEILLDAMKFSKRDFSIRVILGCLKTLQKEIPVIGCNSEVDRYRDRVLALLESALIER